VRFRTCNDFTAIGRLCGNGAAEYVDGGVLARLDFAKSDAGFTYAEASFRAGRASVEFRSDDMGR
jgi:hypothetical protein